jgi:hypothetical protein
MPRCMYESFERVVSKRITDARESLTSGGARMSTRTLNPRSAEGYRRGHYLSTPRVATSIQSRNHFADGHSDASVRYENVIPQALLARVRGYAVKCDSAKIGGALRGCHA